MTGELITAILAVCLLTGSVCADEPYRADVHEIWIHTGDTLVELFGRDWKVVFDANDFPALVRKGRPVRSPDLVPAGMRIRLPSGVHLSQIARERLFQYQLQLRRANVAIAACESTLDLVKNHEDQHSYQEALRLFGKAKRLLWEDRFDFENFAEAERVAKRASLTLKESRKRSSASRVWALPILAAIAIGIGVVVSARLISDMAKSRRPVGESAKATPGEEENKKNWGNALESVHGRSRVGHLADSSIVISTSHGGGCRIPIRRGKETQIKVGSTPHCHVIWPELNGQEFSVRVAGDGGCVTVANIGKTRLDLGDVVLPPSRSLELYLPSELSLNGSTMRISRVTRVFREGLAEVTKEALK